MSYFSQTKVKLSQVVGLAIVVSVVLAGLFIWSYYRNISVFNAVKNVIPATQPGEPEYLFSLRGDSKENNLVWPQYTYVTNDRIYVADSHRVMVFDYSGQYLRSISPKEKAPGALKAPGGMVVVNGELYVADPYIGRVAVFDQNGLFKRYFAEKVLKEPTFIKYRDNKFYVYDINGMKIKILSQDGKLLKEFGGPGSDKGKLAFPYDLDIDEEGNIWVADNNNFRIQVFNQEGSVLHMWPEGSDIKDPTQRKRYTTPRGIAFDQDGFVWTANTIGNYVSVIDPLNGQILGQVNRGADDKDKVSLPTAVFIDHNNRLYVTELGYKRVLVYQL